MELRICVQGTQAEDGSVALAVAPPEGECRSVHSHHMLFGPQGLVGPSGASGNLPLPQVGGTQQHGMGLGDHGLIYLLRASRLLFKVL